jgi:hypothetical protein
MVEKAIEYIRPDCPYFEPMQIIDLYRFDTWTYRSNTFWTFISKKGHISCHMLLESILFGPELLSSRFLLLIFMSIDCKIIKYSVGLHLLFTVLEYMMKFILVAC